VARLTWLILKLTVTLTTVAIAAWVVAVKFQDYLLNPWTRNGQVDAYTVTITPRVTGPIVEQPVKDNQLVHKGDLLFRIDPRTFQDAVVEDEAALGQAIAARDEAQDLVNRARSLYKTDPGAVSKLTLVQKENKLRSAISVVRGAEAQLHSAELDLTFTKIVAPIDGYVTHLQIDIGSHVVANQPVLALIDSNSFWIVGFFKETQIENIHPGDQAIAKLMAYPSKPVKGVVDSLGWGIAQQDGTTDPGNLLPEINPSFDWIRLAQRVPVRIHPTEIPLGVQLRVGITATVIVLHDDDPTKRKKQWIKDFLKSNEPP